MIMIGGVDPTNDTSLRALLDSSVHSPRGIWLYNPYSNRTCLTVWFPCLQMHLPSPIPGTFPWNKNSRSPILSVRICTANALNSTVSPKCSLTMPLLGEGSNLYKARPRVSAVHFRFYSSTTELFLPIFYLFHQLCLSSR